jgi:NAD(P)H-quinone oxidoreductase subunit 5
MSRFKEQSFASAREPALVTRLPAFLAALSAVALLWQTLRPGPVSVAGLSIDRLSSASGLFVGVLGWVVTRFAERSMEGHPERWRFTSLLCFATCMAFVVSCAGNMLLLAVAWMLLGAAVHLLLVFDEDTAVKRRVARRKWVAARVGDVALSLGLALLAWRCGSLEIGECLSRIDSLPGEVLLVVTSLLVVAAMARSVQAPFHVWLPDTMEAPTPVSALLHAGIVNAGGLLLIRFAPLLVRVPEVCVALSIVGTVTMTLGTLCMAQQVRLKQGLAWSTVAQMGFMTVQCALAAFPAALLHLLGHGSYKAMAFLRSGEAPAPAGPIVRPACGLALLVAGALSAVPCMALATRVTGLSMDHAPGELALALVIAIAIGQVWVTSLGTCVFRPRELVRGLSVAVLASVFVPLIGFGLYRGAGLFLGPVLGALPAADGKLMWIAAALPALAIALLAVAHVVQPWLQQLAVWRSMQVQAREGFHLGRIADRAIDATTPARSNPETRHA